MENKKNNDYEAKNNEEKMVELLEKQLFYNRVITVMGAVLFIGIAAIGIFICTFAKNIQVCVDQVTVLTNEATTKVETIDIEKINNLLDRANSTMDVVDDMLETTSEAVVKTNELMGDMKQISETLVKIQDGFNMIPGFGK